jgi:hypothetical protein
VPPPPLRCGMLGRSWAAGGAVRPVEDAIDAQAMMGDVDVPVACLCGRFRAVDCCRSCSMITRTSVVPRAVGRGGDRGVRLHSPSGDAAKLL